MVLFKEFFGTKHLAYKQVVMEKTRLELLNGQARNEVKVMELDRKTLMAKGYRIDIDLCPVQDEPFIDFLFDHGYRILPLSQIS